MRHHTLTIGFAVLAAVACARDTDGTDSAQPQGPAIETASADTLPPVLHPLSLDDLPRGDGPLFPFADSATRPTRWGLRDADGRVVVAPRFHYATPMFEGRAAVAVTGEYGAPRWGYVDARGAVVVPFGFDGAGFFANGRAPVMRDDAYMLVDSSGAVVERLASARAADAAPPALPEPCDSCTLGEYARRLPRVGEPLHLYVQPVVGETFRRIAIVRHRDDLLSVAEGGWEHWIHELRIPGITRAQGEALAKRLMGEGQYTEARDDDDPGALVLRATGARIGSGNEEMRVRVRGGVVEIIHSDGS